MEARRSRAATSWADEVEEEEEALIVAAAKVQIQEKQKKLNPFGLATKPREIILQERAINWINIDHSPIGSRKQKPLKENVPAPVPQTITRKLTNPNIRSSPKHKLQNSEITSYQHKSSQVPHTYDSEFVPPVKYPPKNLIPYLFSSNGTNPYDHGKRDNSSMRRNNQQKMELEDGWEMARKRRNSIR